MASTATWYVQQIGTADTAVLPTNAIVSYDIGKGAAAFDGQNVIAGQDWPLQQRRAAPDLALTQPQATASPFAPAPPMLMATARR